MAIIATDITLYKSQNMNDSALGGGAITATEVTDGTSGDVFFAVSSLDKSGGALSVRKLYVKVDSDNTDSLDGVHAVLTSFSADTAVHEFFISSSAFTKTDMITEFENKYTSEGTNIETMAFAEKGDEYIYSEDTNGVTGGPNALPLNVILILPGGISVILIATAGVTVSVGVYRTKYTLSEPLASVCVSGDVCRSLVDYSVRCYGGSAVASAAASGQKDVIISSEVLQILPTTPGSASEFDYAKIFKSQDIFLAGDTVLLIEGATVEIATIDSIDTAADTLTMLSDLTNSFTTAAICCACCPLGDLQANVVNHFTQTSWDTETFDSVQDGAGASGTYNFNTHPVLLNNTNTLTDKLGFYFITETEFYIISQRYGNLGKGDISIDTTPINPLTDAEYFTLDKDGWGGVFTAGNVLRSDFEGALAVIWLGRKTDAGCVGTATDTADLDIRGDYGGASLELSVELKWEA